MTFALTVVACALALLLPSPVSAESAELQALMTEMETMTVELVEEVENLFARRCDDTVVGPTVRLPWNILAFFLTFGLLINRQLAEPRHNTDGPWPAAGLWQQELSRLWDEVDPARVSSGLPGAAVRRCLREHQ
eukprot:COSAG02_NODE_1709_length_11226_cov_5.225937_6_plen_134_part_00